MPEKSTNDLPPDRPENSNMLDPSVQSAPCSFYAAIHAHGPVYYAEEIDAYVVAGYPELLEVLNDTETYSSEIGDNYFHIQGDDGSRRYREILRRGGWDHIKTLQRTDPPLHKRYRSLVDKVFTPAAVRKIKPEIEAITDRLIEAFIDDGSCEFIGQFALPLPGLVICGELGLDRSELDRFKGWADALLISATVPLAPDELVRVAETEVEMELYLDGVFDRFREKPDASLISHLVNQVTDDGDRLSKPELQNVMHQLISGGFDTTTSALSHAMWLLISHPDQASLLREGRASIKGFINEVLRLESPVQGLMRIASKDTRLGGVYIPAGSHIITRYAAANQDPKKFEDPQTFNTCRKNASSHLAFGSGPHFCVGRQLALQELEVGLSRFLTMFAKIELARPLDDPPHHPSLLLHPLRRLDISFTRA